MPIICQLLQLLHISMRLLYRVENIILLNIQYSTPIIIQKHKMQKCTHTHVHHILTLVIHNRKLHNTLHNFALLNC